jgi:sec-independent protein translocase protein TatB
MLEVGWSEMLVIAIIMIVVVGPKDLPRMLRTFGQFTSKMRGMANDFRKQFDEAMKEADLEDVKSAVNQVRNLNPAADIKKALNPMEKAAADIRAGVDAALKPSAPAATPPPAEPLKTGATAMAGETAPAVDKVAAAPAPVKVEPAAEAKPAARKRVAAAKPAAKAATSAAKAKTPAKKTKAAT